MFTLQALNHLDMLYLDSDSSALYATHVVTVSKMP